MMGWIGMDGEGGRGWRTQQQKVLGRGNYNVGDPSCETGAQGDPPEVCRQTGDVQSGASLPSFDELFKFQQSANSVVFLL